MAQKQDLNSVITNLGESDITDSFLNQGTINWKKFVIGDGNGERYIPTKDQTELRHSCYQGNVNSIKVDERAEDQICFELIVPSNVGGFTVREVGILNDKDELVAVANTPLIEKIDAEYDSDLDMLIEFTVKVSSAENFDFYIDPNTVLATQQQVNALFADIKDQLEVLNEFSEYDERIQTIETNYTDLEKRVKALELALEGVAEFLELKI